MADSKQEGQIMNVSLTQELEELVNQKVQSGMYTSASEVIRAGLRLLAEQDELRQIRFDSLKSDIAEGLEQEKTGQTVSGEAVFKRLRGKHGK